MLVVTALTLSHRVLQHPIKHHVKLRTVSWCPSAARTNTVMFPPARLSGGTRSDQFFPVWVWPWVKPHRVLALEIRTAIGSGKDLVLTCWWLHQNGENDTGDKFCAVVLPGCECGCGCTIERVSTVAFPGEKLWQEREISAFVPCWLVCSLERCLFQFDR